MDFVSSVTSLTFTAAKDQLHSETKMTFPLPLLRFSVNLTHRGHFIHSRPIDPHVSDMISLSLMSQFVESFTAIVCCLLCLCAAYVWARNWFTCQWFQKAAFITRKQPVKMAERWRCQMLLCRPQSWSVNKSHHYQTAKQSLNVENLELAENQANNSLHSFINTFSCEVFCAPPCTPFTGIADPTMHWPADLWPLL